ncbi:type II toxin-antitoxin system prevent-host-death family antitoxin [Nostoc sp. ChiQUE01b]|uniref:type II toxin-antitoxin system prevent-host-death family antitoxin n=1 Tax=Nostoc sp. ChiQUE01b TaxID=3075376 RepID=UPI002AD525DD|nr:type II toxin-antitoxin system prevent-host-death family antitoxin [Nostoc sp. ChiQUE01b]MDZ8261753.1 type II toxin-antitoxin system prevent-host-death family antitoxin [Nostoc sp. ChiQUE01b]
MNWRIAEAKQRFSELINAVTKEPQRIYNQNQLVAVVVKAEMFEEFLVWRKQHEKMSLADAFKELRQIAAEEDYILEVPSRQDRPSPFADAIDDFSV